MCDQVYVTCSCCDSFLLGLIFFKTIDFYFALSYSYCHDLSKGNEIKIELVCKLLWTMKKESIAYKFQYCFLCWPLFSWKLYLNFCLKRNVIVPHKTIHSLSTLRKSSSKLWLHQRWWWKRVYCSNLQPQWTVSSGWKLWQVILPESKRCSDLWGWVVQSWVKITLG